MRTQPLCLLALGASLIAVGCKKESEVKPATEPSATASRTPSAAPAAPKPASGAAMTGSPIDACSMLTKAEAEAATGRKLQDPTGKKDAWSSCRFTLVDPPAPIVDLDVIHAADAMMAKQMFQEFAKDEGPTEPAPGIGDTAYWNETNVLRILKGSYVVIVNVSSEHMGVDKEPERKAAKPIAEKILARLP